MKHGCCYDRSCTPDTCMNLPADSTCANCWHLDRCMKLFGCDPGNTSCDFFPRRFVPHKFDARMTLPEGVTCGHCKYVLPCMMIGLTKVTCTDCHFSPQRFDETPDNRSKKGGTTDVSRPKE